MNKLKVKIEQNNRTSGQRDVAGLHPLVFNAIEDRMIGWIEKKLYLRAGVTIEKTARQIGTNRYYLSEYINTTYSMIFRQWINHLRITEAQSLLRQYPNMTVKDIALLSGFINNSHFGKIFLQITNYSPQKWRSLTPK